MREQESEGKRYKEEKVAMEMFRHLQKDKRELRETFEKGILTCERDKGRREKERARHM